jgi:hypothetical protein
LFRQRRRIDHHRIESARFGDQRQDRALARSKAAIEPLRRGCRTGEDDTGECRMGEGGLAAQQMMDFSINKALDGALIKIPGFIVPLDVGKDGLVTEFFLVPYFGACIHVPPPPPNQIVYVRMNKGIALDSIYEAYWITGRMKVSRKATRLGASAYQLDASKVEIYKY